MSDALVQVEPAEPPSIAIARAQVLLDLGLPEELHEAWSAMAGLTPAQREQVWTLLRDPETILDYQQSAATVARQNASVSCSGCKQQFPLWALHPSPYQSFDRRCEPCMEKLDRAMVHELAKRGIRSAKQRSARDATLTDAQWAKTVAHFDDRCAYCAFMHWRVVEHATPVRFGGETHWYNVVPACYGCNAKKGIHTIEELLTVPRFGRSFDQARLERVRAWLVEHGREREMVSARLEKPAQPKVAAKKKR